LSVWAMLLGMATIINITLVGALISLAGNIPDSSFLVILSRYLRKKEESARVVLYPVDAAVRLERVRKRAVIAVIASASIAGGLTVYALAVGWGTVAMLAITFWLVAGNLAFLQVPLGLWRRRAGRMGDEAVEEAMGKALPELEQKTNGSAGNGENHARGEG
jgi:hypothetical protein